MGMPEILVIPVAPFLLYQSCIAELVFLQSKICCLVVTKIMLALFLFPDFPERSQ